ncbi:tyrosine-type recombinase/integrase [Janthinobacterium lividum]|uniref:Tyrosine-type recombinase/integrase n=3 Tax=Oxalobacteraceae TaxID=75682 RepID=A0AAJ4MU61_9BURK|nr:phage integrase family protein [Janthinobacterium lividum]QSX97210.1 tyrosine-type recombinase/integrase [Janthinobacterium lividum]
MVATVQLSYKLVATNPDAHSFESLCKSAGIANVVNVDLSRRFADLKAVVTIVDEFGHPVYVPTMFLLEHAVKSRGITISTARTYAESLLDWLRFLSTRNVPMEQASEEDLMLYRAHLVHCELRGSGECYATATVNLRVTVAALYHEWAWRMQVLPTPLGEYLVSGDHRCSPLVRVIRRIPQVLTTEQIGSVFSLAREPYKLMFQWGLCSGARRVEVCELKLSSLPTIEQLSLSSEGLVTIRAQRKGGKELPIVVPTHLVEKTHWYCLTDRESARPGSERYVFLNRNGDKVGQSSLSTEFRRCADLVGLRHFALHSLRHTYATNVLAVLQSSADPIIAHNAPKILQVLMGHARLETTELYVHLAQTQNSDVVEALSYLYGASQ